MTVSTLINKNQYEGNGSTTVFAYQFPIAAATDLEVWVDPAEGADQELVLDTDYTVSGVGNPSGGNVTYPISGDPLPAGDWLTIIRVTPMTQSLDLVNQGGVIADNEEAAFDKLTRIVQDVNEKFERVSLAPPTAPPGEEALTETTADQLYVRQDGTTTVDSDLSLGGNKITQLLGGVAATDAATRGQLDAKFTTDTGHDHDGTDSKRVVFSAIDTTGQGNGAYLTVHNNLVQAWAPLGGGQLLTDTALTAAYQDICSVTLVVTRTTTNVMMMFSTTMSGAVGASESSLVSLKFVRDSTDIEEVVNACYVSQGASAHALSFDLPVTVCRIHVPGATGTFTFKIQAKYGAGSTAVSLVRSNLQVIMWG